MPQTEEKKYKLNRKTFIEWVASDNPDLLTSLSAIKDDLIKGGEYILTAQDVLDTYNEIPSHLFSPPTEEEFVSGFESKLYYHE